MGDVVNDVLLDAVPVVADGWSLTQTDFHSVMTLGTALLTSQVVLIVLIALLLGVVLFYLFTRGWRI